MLINAAATQHSPKYLTKLIRAIGIIFVAVALILSFLFVHFVYIPDREHTEKQTVNNAEQFSSWNDARLRTSISLLEELRKDDDFVKLAYETTQANLLGVYKKISVYSHIYSDYNIDIGVIKTSDPANVTARAVNGLNMKSFKLPENITTAKFAFREECSLSYSFYSGVQVRGASFFKLVKYSGDRELLFFFTLIDNVSLFSDTGGTGDYAVLIQDIGSVFQLSDTYLDQNTLLESPFGFTKTHKYILAKVPSTVDSAISYTYSREESGQPLAVLSVLLIVSMLGVAVLCAFIIANTLYRPIRRLSRIISSFGSASQDNSDELEYIASITNNMHRRISELETRDTKTVNVAKSKTLMDILSGFVPNEIIEKTAANDGLDILTRRHFVAIVDIINFAELEEEYSRLGFVYIKQDVIDIFRQKLEGKETLFTEDGYTSFAFVCSGEFPEVSNLAEEITADLSMEFNITITVSASAAAETPYDTPRSYAGAIMLKNRHTGGISSFEDGDIKNLTGMYYPLDVEKQVIEYTLNGRADLAQPLLDRIIDINFKNNPDNMAVTQLRYALLGTINRILSFGGESVQTVFIGADEKYLYSKDNTDRGIKAEVEAMLAAVSERAAPAASTNVFYDKAKQFIDDNMQRDISLYDLGDYLGYSLWHTSRVFKETFGLNFKQYVNTQKIEKAKRMLSEGVSINGVVSKLGFNSGDTFVRIFKKYTGVSPKNYRDKKGL
jgi:AraC-like DNA-binding protein